MPNYVKLASEVFLTASQSRELDRVAIEQFGIHSLVLMENAGNNAAQQIASRFRAESKVTVLAGSGNNGGDGWVIARHLSALGFETRGILIGQRAKLSPDNLSNILILEKSGFPLITVDAELPISAGAPLEPSSMAAQWLHDSDIVIDALLGTGSKGAPREPMTQWIEFANSLSATRVAIDLPSGLDADSGVVSEPTFRADLTLTMASQKGLAITKSDFRQSSRAHRYLQPNSLINKIRPPSHFALQRCALGNFQTATSLPSRTCW